MRVRYLVIVILLLVSIGILGCESPLPTTAENTTVVSSITAKADVQLSPSDNNTWIRPGKVMVSNYYPGAVAEWTMSIYNGKDIPAKFSVNYRSPNTVGEGYSMPMASTKTWVTITDSTPMVQSKETKDILVKLSMPADIKNSPKQWEFWVGVIDTTQVGSIVNELASRWLITMR